MKILYKEKILNITEYCNEAYKTATEKGFHEKFTNFGEKVMLIITELAEAVEADRHKHYAMDVPEESSFDSPDFVSTFEAFTKDTVEDEIADTFIRLFDLCADINIDIESHIKAKMAYNKTRLYKHGKHY